LKLDESCISNPRSEISVWTYQSNLSNFKSIPSWIAIQNKYFSAKLHDPRTLSTSNLPERVAVQREGVNNCDCSGVVSATYSRRNEAEVSSIFAKAIRVD